MTGFHICERQSRRSQYRHYPYSADAFTTIFSGLPPFISGGKGQVQIAP